MIRKNRTAKKPRTVVMSLVHVSIPTGDTYIYLEVMDSDFEDYDVIIGMDTIDTGDFRFTDADGRSQFSFRYPAKEHITLK